MVLTLLAAVTVIIELCAGDRWVLSWAWWDDAQRVFIWQLRIPRTLAMMLVVANLAMSGAVMQAIFDNPLAEPDLLGVANGAGVALVLSVLAGARVATRLGAERWRYYYGGVSHHILAITLHFARRRISNARLLRVLAKA
ncbi:MAG: iron chelate uptake ABC transporter family permease subunit [Symbiopectobacterium sp.]